MNEAILDAINGQAGRLSFADSVARFLANDGIFVLAGVLLLLGVVELRRDRSRGLRVAVSAAAALLVTGALLFIAGHLIVEQRPFVHERDTVLLIRHAADNGFPSDHASVSAAAAAIGALAWPRWSLWLLALLVLTGAARVFVGVHYPGDVLAGWVGGGAAALLAWKSIGAAWKHLPDRMFGRAAEA